MNRLKMTSMVLLFSVCVLSVCHSTAPADVVSVDWNTQGDGLLTRDLTNGLDWLDLNQTMEDSMNRSFNDINSELGAGGEFEGFRHASTVEIIDLWTSAGIPDIDSGGTAANAAPVQNLIALMGDGSLNPVTRFSFGILSDSSSANTHQSAMLDTSDPFTLGRARTNQQDVADDATNINGGHYLVRAVPEPAAVGWLGTGCFLFLMRRRSRRRVSVACR